MHYDWRVGLIQALGPSMKYLWLSVFLVLSPSVAHATQGRCVVPVPDGADIEPSPASLSGRLVQVKPGQVVVRPVRGKDITVHVNSRTGFFTAYGGGVEAHELKAGQYASIWLKDCAKPGKSPALAVYLELCSLAAEPCPK